MRDIDVRHALYKGEIKAFLDDPNSLVVDELGLCQGDARIDIAVINGLIHGYEIKSDRDTLDRLPGQEAIYSQVLDTVTLVIGESHIDKARTMVPEWWGLTRVSESGTELVFESTRPAIQNPSPNPYSLAQLLWKAEVLHALEDTGSTKGLKSKPKKVLWAALADRLSFSELSSTVRTALKVRQTWRADRPHI